ncbi:MAG: helicase-related protein, partial [Notoacmeibacter sp.]
MDGLDQYRKDIAGRKVRAEPAGFSDIPALHPLMKPHQIHSTEFALRQGRAMLALDTGLGKSLCALEWGRVVVERTNRSVIMFAPMAVAPQHEREAIKWGLDAKAIRDPSEIGAPRVYITNYDRQHLFDAADFSGVILDESSILKSFTGSTSRTLRDVWSRPKFRLACTATPAPNDHMEIGQHSDFLGAMPPSEMLARWFIADQANMGKYRIKRAAGKAFWQWVASWARCVSKPSDLGFDDTGYDLPELIVRNHIIAADRSEDAGEERDGQGRLFRMPDTSATSIHVEKRKTIAARADAIAAVDFADANECRVIWVDADYEADAVMARIPGAVEVRGSMKPDEKEARLDAFSSGNERVLVTKPRIAGYGLNWQHCARMGFAGLSFSYEAYYQAIRRCWRFGQTRPVHVDIAMADTERAIYDTVNRKAGNNEVMKRQMNAAMREAFKSEGLLHDY